MSSTAFWRRALRILTIPGLALILTLSFTTDSFSQAGTQFNPYYGKNRVKYDDFECTSMQPPTLKSFTTRS